MTLSSSNATLRSRTAAGQTLAEKILRAYGVAHAEILPSQKGYRNRSFPVRQADGTMLNLVLYKREPDILQRIRAANAVSDFLTRQGFPARRTVDPRIVKLESGRGLRFGTLYTYLPGRTIPWEAYTKDHIKQLGKAMSDMHAALRTCPYADLPEVADEYLAVNVRMRRYFSQAPVQRAMTRKLGLAVCPDFFEKFEQLLTACKLLPDKQPLHMDFVRSNLLFGEESSEAIITGILDFEKTAYGHPIFDIARTLAFLIVDCKYKSEAKVRKYFITSGYDKRGVLPFPRKIAYALLESLIDLFLLHDFYKFLRHNPYEALAANEHFVRTRQLLITRRLLIQ